MAKLDWGGLLGNEQPENESKCHPEECFVEELLLFVLGGAFRRHPLTSTLAHVDKVGGKKAKRKCT